MKFFLISFSFLLVSNVIQAQLSSFEGVIQYTVLLKQDQDYLINNLIGFRKLGLSEKEIRSFYADSIRFFYYVKQDSIWADKFINDDSSRYSINYQAGFQAEIINPYDSRRTVLGKTKEIEDDLDQNSSDPNWREKIKISEWFKTDYSKLKKIARRQEMINGFLCQLYELPSNRADGNSRFYWITEDIQGGKDQLIPYSFDGIFSPKGLIVKKEMRGAAPI
jgi:hypothetical protein